MKQKKAQIPGSYFLLIVILLLALLFVVLYLVGIIGSKATVKIPFI